MPRPRREAVEPAPSNVVALKPNSMVASAVAVTNRRLRPVTGAGNGTEAWQAEAWGFFDTCGEFAFAVNWLANALSKVRLLVVHDAPAGDTMEEAEVTEGLPADALASLFGGEAGQPQMMAGLGIHMSVPGAAFVVGFPGDQEPGGQDRWELLSTDECKRGQGGKGWTIDRGDGDPQTYDDEQILVIRIWRPHPRRWVQATSPARAALPVLRELEGLTQHVASSIDSRLSGAGVLVLPSEMTFAPVTAADANDPSGPIPELDEGTEAADPFIDALIEAAATARRDRGSAAAMIPVIVKAPGAVIGNIKHLTFATPFDAQAGKLREEAIRRLALSLDMPPEVLLGQADSNHWSAWQISEDALKLHVGPLCELICHALTTRFLWPVLEGRMDFTDPARINEEADAGTRAYRITFDDSELRMRPSRTAEAAEAHARMVLSDEAYLRETGFGPEDMPEDEELRRRLTIATASGVTTADLTAAALAELGVNLTPQPSDVASDAATEETPTGEVVAIVPPAAAPVEPAPEARRTLPQERAQAAALMAAAEQVCGRAIERARNKVGHRGKTVRPIPADKLDAALTGAWGGVPRVAALTGVDAARLEATLSKVVRASLTSGTDLHPVLLSEALAHMLRADG